LHPEAWDILTPEEKQDVLAKFPDGKHILAAGTANARPNTVSLRNDDNFRHDCARYQENIELGRHDEEWLSQAWTAHEKHKRGDYDEFLREQFEGQWSVKLPREQEAKNGESKEAALQPAASSRTGAKDAPSPEGDEGTEEKGRKTTQGIPTGVAQNNPKARHHAGSGSIDPIHPDLEEVEVGEPIVVLRSD
jgi:hypothetical protein